MESIQIPKIRLSGFAELHLCLWSKMKIWNKIVQCATQNPTIVITEVTVKFIKILGHFNIYKEGLIQVCCIESHDCYGQRGKEQYYFSGKARQRLPLLLTQIL